MVFRRAVWIFSYAVFFVLISFDEVSSQGIQLIRNGKSQYSIVTPQDASDTEKMAADTLQAYINKMSGCMLPIISKPRTVSDVFIYVGKSIGLPEKDIIGIAEDGILIKQLNNNLFITGGSRKGVLNAVFTFLEEYLGCVMYAADDMEVPKKKTITLPSNLYKKHNPSFSNRMTLYRDGYSYSYCDWRRLNPFLSNWGLWVHSFENLLPQAQYFSAHPEYYALVNGKRTPTQIDLSNPNVLRIVIQNLEVMMKAKPGALYWSVSQNDNSEYCDCPQCHKLNIEQKSPQGSLLTFVNAVAKYFPQKIITTLAYSYSQAPPLTLKPAKNVMIMLATGGIEDRRTPIAFKADKAALAFDDHFNKWSKICSRLFVWDYIAQYDHVFLPFPNLTALQPNIQYFASKKVFYLFEQGIASIEGEFSELKCYLVSKLMWNKDVNVAEAKASFLNHYYGAQGAVFIDRYIALLQQNAAKSNTPVSHYAKLNEAFKTYLSPKNVNEYKKIFDTALAIIGSDSQFGRRVFKEYLSILYAELEGNKHLKVESKQLNATIMEYKSKLDVWTDGMKKLDLKYVSLTGLTVDDYYKSYLNHIRN